MEKLWTTSEVAQFLGVEESDVERLVREGHLTAYQLGGKFLRFQPDQVKALKRHEQVGLRTGRLQAEPIPLRKRVADFFYFNDFYLLSAILLTLLIIYLMASG